MPAGLVRCSVHQGKHYVCHTYMAMFVCRMTPDASPAAPHPRRPSVVRRHHTKTPPPIGHHHMPKKTLSDTIGTRYNTQIGSRLELPAENVLAKMRTLLGRETKWQCRACLLLVPLLHCYMCTPWEFKFSIVLFS